MVVAHELAADHLRIMGLVDGRPVSMMDPEIQRMAELEASGEVTRGELLTMFEETALGVEDSPHWRTQHTELLDSRARGIAVENLQLELENLSRSWGVTIPGDSLRTWAESISENVNSMADFEGALEQQASVLYPNRPAGMRTLDYAQPWLNTLSRTLETSADLMDDRVQQALQSGMTAFEFQQQLMQSQDWLETENASDTLTSAFGSAARLMGFA